ncbi:hypothetical protein T484DRAFT_1969749 [Baffinella frigidus]|nr:hypothetical protein T484DRAFT_1969749 [Cryptophyta sp. CCMP2293]
MRIALEDEGLVVSTMELLSGRSIDELATQKIAACDLSDRNHGVDRRGSMAVESTLEMPASPGRQVLRAHFLSRICVQPPYFALEDFSVEKDLTGVELSARAPVQTWAEHEGGPISGSEAARHLAILGLCAVSLQNPTEGRVYYPIKTASMRIDTTLPRITTATLHIKAICTSFDLVGGEACATATMLGESGEVVAFLEVTYHMIGEHDFSKIFKDYKVETSGAFLPGSPDPYLAWPITPAGTGGEESSPTQVELGLVEVDMCAGHFDGYPAFPVSVMQRHVTNALTEAVCKANNWRAARVTMAAGAVITHRFAWAGKHVVLSARREGDGGANSGEEKWVCDISAEEGAVATFKMTLLVENTGV